MVPMFFLAGWLSGITDVTCQGFVLVTFEFWFLGPLSIRLVQQVVNSLCSNGVLEIA
jgi:hypothetical protein